MDLISTAQKISSMAAADPFFAIHTSLVEPLPHQLSAVYKIFLPRDPLNFVLADDPGAGKTIMTGLLIRELIRKKNLRRVLIVCPGTLTEQWQDELLEKFQLDFEIIDSDFSGTEFCIAALDKLTRDEDIQHKLRATRWELIVCDEAHKISASLYGKKISETKRFRLAKNILRPIAQNFLLLTATPHNGKENDFKLFMSLVTASKNFSAYMRRLLKEDLLTFDAAPLFTDRIVRTVNYTLAPLEKNLYDAVTAYVRYNFNLADRLNNQQKHTVGFALTILQRRLASSPEAIYQSLKRRAARLEDYLDKKINVAEYEYDEDLDAHAEELVDGATGAREPAEIRYEIAELKKLTALANRVRASHVDRKWNELSTLLQHDEILASNEKIIIFTEHKDTLDYLADKIRNLGYSVVTIDGSLTRRERQTAVDKFKADAKILVATDAAGEGINLQCAHLMINYDLPWNPNRLEQRFGRIHRIGQIKTCFLWNLVAVDTREGKVFQRLFEKLEVARHDLGGKVFDILGKVSFNNRPLSELLLAAIRDDRKNLQQTIDNSLSDAKLSKLLQTHAVTNDKNPASEVFQIRAALKDAEKFILPPAFIEHFAIRAFDKLCILHRGTHTGIYEITDIPKSILRRDPRIKEKYPAVCFDKKIASKEVRLLCPTHPLFDAVLKAISEMPPPPPENPTDKKSVEEIAMQTVMNLERQAGFFPVDVSADNLGYDIDSARGNERRLIEVKGRTADADTVTVTRNEILTARRNPDTFILAIVRVSPHAVHTAYIPQPFKYPPDPAALSVNFSVKALLSLATLQEK